jgi:hypothetical protein
LFAPKVSALTEPMKKASEILLLCLGFQWGWSQQGFQLVGKVTDTVGTAIPGATVQLFLGRDSISALTSDSGLFEIGGLHRRTFRILVSHAGFEPFAKTVNVVGNVPIFRLSRVVLRTAYRNLDPVTVSRTRPVTLNGDTLSYYAGAYPVRDGSAVAEILKRLPGIEVDLEGNVLVQGKKLEKVLVNGKEFFGGDVLLAISNLPADVVDKLQLIDDYGDKARLTGIRIGEPSKILNIVLKQDKQNGYFGHAQAGPGSTDRYADELFANSFRGSRQLSVNGTANNNSPAGPDHAGSGAFSYADQWGPRRSGGINGGITDDHPETSSSLIQQTYYPGQELNMSQGTRNISQNRGMTSGGIITFRPTPNSLLRLSPNGGNQRSNQVVSINSITEEQDSGYAKTTRTSAVNKTATDSWNGSGELYYERTFPASRQRFSIQGTAMYSDTRQNADQQSSSTAIIGSQAVYAPLRYLVSNGNRAINLNLQSNFYSPVGRHGFLDLGYWLQKSNMRSNRSTESVDSSTGSMQLVDSLSLNNQYQTVTHNIHSGYVVKQGPVTVNLNLDGQPVSLSGAADAKGDVFSYRHLALLPGMQSNWDLLRGRMLSLSYRTSTGLPTLQQISPVTDLTNPQYPVTGNPGLKPSYTHSIGLHYEGSALKATQFSGIGGGISYSITFRPIIPATQHPKDSSQVVQTTTYINAGQVSALAADYHVTFPAFARKRLRLTTNGNISRGESTTFNDQQPYTTRSLTWSQGMHLQLLIPDVVEMDIEGNYSLTHSSYNSSSALPANVQTARLDAGGKQYFLKRWSISGRLTEQFNSRTHGLEPTPAQINGILQCQFLSHNKASVTITGYNLTGSTGASQQSTSANTVTRLQTSYTGRYYLLTFAIKLEKFR